MVKKPCSICNHSKNAHGSLGCMDCFVADSLIREEISFEYNHKYKMDNLRYLENLCQ